MTHAYVQTTNSVTMTVSEIVFLSCAAFGVSVLIYLVCFCICEDCRRHMRASLSDSVGQVHPETETERPSTRVIVIVHNPSTNEPSEDVMIGVTTTL